jgi:hypothetical protein
LTLGGLVVGAAPTQILTAKKLNKWGESSGFRQKYNSFPVLLPGRSTDISSCGERRGPLLMQA